MNRPMSDDEVQREIARLCAMLPRGEMVPFPDVPSRNRYEGVRMKRVIHYICDAIAALIEAATGCAWDESF